MTAEFVRFVTQLPNALALAGAFLVAGFLVTRLAFHENPFARFLAQLASFAGFTVMLLGAGVLPSEPTPKGDPNFEYLVISVFKVAWWLAASWLFAGFFRAVLVFKRQPRETRFLQDLVVGVIYVAAVLAIIANVFDMPVSGLLAASGIVAIVLGLALQNTLGDVFSGIVLNLAKPYHPGDWIILDGGTQGCVIETDWRATHILTPDNDLAIIPNSIIAKTKLINASQPMEAHGLMIVVRLEPTIAPSGGRVALQAALLSCNRILRTPAPTVAVRSLDAVAIEYEIQFFVSTIEQGPDAQTELFDLVFRHCASAGIRLAPPSGSPRAAATARRATGRSGHATALARSPCYFRSSFRGGAHPSCPEDEAEDSQGRRCSGQAGHRRSSSFHPELRRPCRHSKQRDGRSGSDALCPWR